jgi:hypothetical protein
MRPQGPRASAQKMNGSTVVLRFRHKVVLLQRLRANDANETTMQAREKIDLDLDWRILNRRIHETLICAACIHIFSIGLVTFEGSEQRPNQNLTPLTSKTTPTTLHGASVATRCCAPATSRYGNSLNQLNLVITPPMQTRKAKSQSNIS